VKANPEIRFKIEYDQDKALKTLILFMPKTGETASKDKYKFDPNKMLEKMKLT
jgi:hypothetical protein